MKQVYVKIWTLYILRVINATKNITKYNMLNARTQFTIITFVNFTHDSQPLMSWVINIQSVTIIHTSVITQSSRRSVHRTWGYLNQRHAFPLSKFRCHCRHSEPLSSLSCTRYTLCVQTRAAAAAACVTLHNTVNHVVQEICELSANSCYA